MNRVPPEIVCRILSLLLDEFPPAIGAFEITSSRHKAIINGWNSYRQMSLMRKYSTEYTSTTTPEQPASSDYHLVDAEMAVLQNLHTASMDEVVTGVNAAVIAGTHDDDDMSWLMQGHITDFSRFEVQEPTNLLAADQVTDSELLLTDPTTDIPPKINWKQVFTSNYIFIVVDYWITRNRDTYL